MIFGRGVGVRDEYLALVLTVGLVGLSLVIVLLLMGGV